MGLEANGLIFGDSFVKELSKYVATFASIDKAQSSMQKIFHSHDFGRAGKRRSRFADRFTHRGVVNQTRGSTSYQQEFKPQFYPQRNRSFRRGYRSRGFQNSGPIHYRALQRLKIHLREGFGYEDLVSLDHDSRIKLQWWLDHLDTWKGRAIFSTAPDLVLESDASRTGWGARCAQFSTGGLWSKEELSLHINCLEILAGSFAIQTFAKDKLGVERIGQLICIGLRFPLNMFELTINQSVNIL
ncbi:hypothetical protein NDU88_000144 [Pleurodeles waltl]|uniref:Uncharacterized protein n=1 Tax=Pleurodeles waltl TaxID=8319 RepID=A0AAV7R4U4_PLEWA|nr:hypothetical protein NDU88_000144 [Pleurodeles waltl]